MSAMILAFDIGNTFAKWGFVQDGAVVGGGRAVHRGRGLAATLEAARFDRVPHRVVAVNVAGPEAEAALAAWAERHHRLGVEPITTATSAKRVRTAYRDPARLGADRWAAAVGAFHAYGACLVADLGTACTLDLVGRDGVHAGGYIVPGIDLMRDALRSGTDAVQVEDVEIAPGTLGLDTASGVAAGLRRSLAGLIDSAVATHGRAGAVLVLTGGDADRVAPWVRTEHRIDHDLVLRGAALLAEGRA